jgi:hypothetical protein
MLLSYKRYPSGLFIHRGRILLGGALIVEMPKKLRKDFTFPRAGEGEGVIIFLEE